MAEWSAKLFAGSSRLFGRDCHTSRSLAINGSAVKPANAARKDCPGLNTECSCKVVFSDLLSPFQNISELF
ncbi:hypothetical protein GbCGDNIH6_8199 [Granulibacter bethesdensis]|nr:hypothetical protein GbCGDNIH6_8199 [Granulibacter bethesdensis]